MNEVLSQVSHRVHSTDTNLSIWWVDDCFTNDTKDGGYLPIATVREGKVSMIRSKNNSTYIYEMLLEIAQDEHLNFFVCSFEYAETNWEELNNSKNIVLIDIGYEGKEPEVELTYGINFFLEMTKNRPLYASVAFLTIDAQRVTNWIIKTGNWLPSMPFPIAKTRQAPDPEDELKRPPEQEVRAFVRYFKAHQPKRASEWSFETWRALRNKAKDICYELGNSGIGHSKWAHHLPFGGHYWTNPGDKNKVEPFTKRLRNELEMVSPDVEKLPDHYWEAVKTEDIPGWDRPPIRALAQFDGDGKDLTAMLHLLQQDINLRPEIQLNILFPPRGQTEYPLKHDFLWFNACALARGLYTLAESFAHEVAKRNAGQQAVEGFPKWHWRGRIFWHLTESLE
ncbi:MAG: hypothetical protein ACE5NG_05960, partial [bacterium]